MRALFASPQGRGYAVAVGSIAAATVVAMLVLWPGESEHSAGAGLAGATERAEVETVEEHTCPGPAPLTPCRTLAVAIETGPDSGESVAIELPAGALVPDIDPGDEVRVTRTELPPEFEPEPGAEPSPASYSITDFERRSPMLWLAIAFAVIVVVFGRLRGALSLIGLCLSLAVVLAFIVPAILDGREPLVVAVVGSLAVMLLTISLAHGLGAKSVAAMLGTATSLVLVAVLALVFTELTHLTGLSSEEASILSLDNAELSLQGLLVAGMVVGALGVLDDVTVSQASTVLALRAANPGLGARELYRSAIAVGRDHVSATVNTLVLAYVGASLPVLLIFSSSALGLVDAINVELVAKEIVAMLVGSIGLIAAVPITTALAGRLASALPAERLDAEAVAHSHG